MNDRYQYLFVLGTIPALSLAELHFLSKDVKGEWHYRYLHKHAVVIETTLAPEEILTLAKRFGGIVKLVHIHRTVEKIEYDDCIALLPRIDQKIYFGISCYSLHASIPALSTQYVKQLGVAIKTRLRAQDIASRFVTSREDTLSAVVVTTNKLLSSRGAEIVIAGVERDRFLLGTTLYVQPYESFAYRDMGRPKRDARAGMIPPKLARMMLNIVFGGVPRPWSILDPFCGSGTILQEALSLGIDNIYGSDQDPHAVQRTRDNMVWYISRGRDPQIALPSHVHLHTGDARNSHVLFQGVGMNGITTEPYLGPPLTRPLTLTGAQSLSREVAPLYYESLASCARLLPLGGRIAMVWPYWNTTSDRYVFVPEDPQLIQRGLRPLAPLPSSFIQTLHMRDGYHAARASLLYARSDQFVFREIKIFEKIQPLI